MNDVKELHKIIYSLLASQIEFGTYRYGDPLPKMEDASRWFSVSLDTVRAAYLQLKQEGYITLTKRAGAAVAIHFEAADFERHIQKYFSLRKDSVMDLCQSLDPLFSHAQWYAMKNAKPERLDELERLCIKPEALTPYVMVQHVWLIYGTLNNALLLRLVWQAFLFYQAAFLSLPENLKYFEDSDGPLLHMIDLCRRKDWKELWSTVVSYQEQLTESIRQFYENRITMEPSDEPITFHWNAYQNSSQHCYSLAMELLDGIRQGVYMYDSFLPAPAKIAQEKHVSVSTVRRTLALLNQLGATRSINGVGTQILDTGSSAQNCDFSQPLIRKRLLDFAQSLQILALTCAACSKEAITAMGSAAIEQWKKQLQIVKKSQRYESVVFASLEIIPQFSPIQAVRIIYGQLLHILIWGYPLRSMHGSKQEINDFYLPYIDSLMENLERRDKSGLASLLEKLLWHEFEFAVNRLIELDINGASILIIQGH